MIRLFEDKDIKIVGDKPSESVKRYREQAMQTVEKSAEQIAAAKEFGASIAREFFNASSAYSDAVEDSDFEMFVQRLYLLSFTVSVSFENRLLSDEISGVAQKSFLDTICKEHPEIYKYTSDTGAFSFYYLAFRRGGDVERRIGQTFAMLCAHDGDPIYQELGEVLYCWFSSLIGESAKQFNLS